MSDLVPLGYLHAHDTHPLLLDPICFFPPSWWLTDSFSCRKSIPDESEEEGVRRRREDTLNDGSFSAASECKASTRVFFALVCFYYSLVGSSSGLVGSRTSKLSATVSQKFSSLRHCEGMSEF